MPEPRPVPPPPPAAQRARAARRLTPTLAVVVPATDRPATLDRCRRAIAAAADGPEELHVVDGPTGLGVCSARNRGATAASADVLVFVDSDVAVAPDAFTRIRAAFAADPGLTAVFGSYCDSPSEPGVVSAFRNLLHHHVHQEGAGPAQTFWSGLGAVRRDAFLRAGGFDCARYPVPSVEDIELGARLTAQGARVRLDACLQGTHLKRWTLGAMVRTDFARRGVPWLRLQLEAGRPGRALNLGWRHRLSALACLVGACAGLGRAPRAAVAALAAQIVLNRRFYVLLARRRGPRLAVAGVALHAVHHLTAVAVVPVAVIAHVGDRVRRGGTG